MFNFEEYSKELENRIAKLETLVESLSSENEILKSENKALKLENNELREKVGLNSKTSSLPSSRDIQN